MINNDLKINALKYGDIVQQLANSRCIHISEARQLIADMSFSEYCALAETITPPSGQTIGPTGPTTAPTNSGQATKVPTQNSSNVKAIWPGKGAPVEVGMTVGVKGPNGVPVPGTISQVDQSAKGVKIKNPTTGQDEWANMDALEPFMAQAGQPGQVPAPGQQATTEDDRQLSRLRELAGIKEMCSSGATGAGSIAIVAQPMGGIKRRQPTEEQFKKEYERKEAPKTIVGDTKPHQASGELSSNLAVRGKKTASRSNNGFKR